MARAQAIETRLEKLLPAVEEYYVNGVFPKDVCSEIMRIRRQHEYRLVAKPLLLLDVRNAVEYEMQLEEQMHSFCSSSKVILRHRWSIVERIESIYRIGMKHVKASAKEHETLRVDFVQFLKQSSRRASLSKLYAELMISQPRRSDIWCEAAMWEATDGANLDNARTIVQQAMTTMSDVEAVWTCALEVELLFAHKLIHSMIDDRVSAAKTAKRQQDSVAAENRLTADAADAVGAVVPSVPAGVSDVLRSENTHLAMIVLDLGLASVVVDEALRSPASSPALVLQLMAVCAAYPYTRPLVRHVLHQSMEAGMKVLGDPKSVSQKQLSSWVSPAFADLLVRFLCMEKFMTDHKVSCDVESYITLKADEFNDGTHTADGKGGEAEKRAIAYTTLKISGKDHARSLTEAITVISTLLMDDDLHRSPLAIHVPHLQKEVTKLFGIALETGLISETAVSSAARLIISNAGAEIDSSALAEDLVKGWASVLHATKRAKASGATDVATEVEKVVNVASERLDTLNAWLTTLTDSIDNSSAGVAAKRRKVEVSAVSTSRNLVWGQLLAYLSPADAAALNAGVTSTGKKAGKSGTKGVRHATQRLTAFEVDQFVIALQAMKGQPKMTAELLGFFTKYPILPDGVQTEEFSVDTMRRFPLRYNPDTTPLNLWKVYWVLEKTLGQNALKELEKETKTHQSPKAKGASKHKAAAGEEDSSDDDDDDETSGSGINIRSSGLVVRRRQNVRRQRHAAAPSSSATQFSFADAGLQFLASAPFGVLSEQEAAERCIGVYQLAAVHLEAVFGQPAEQALQSGAAAASLEGTNGGVSAVSPVSRCTLEAGLSFLSDRVAICVPVPRQVYSLLTIPLLERLIESVSQQVKDPVATAKHIRAARAAYEHVLAMYSTSKAAQQYIPLVTNCTVADETLVMNENEQKQRKNSRKGDDARVFHVQELNAQDWGNYLHFTRDVAKDLPGSKEVAFRARKEALDAQRVLVKISGHR